MTRHEQRALLGMFLLIAGVIALTGVALALVLS